jgi:hypothetical protein
MSTQPSPRTMTDTDKLLHLSLLLKALDDCDQELSDAKAEHKARRTKLEGELAQIRWEVLSGQERLPLEPIPDATINSVVERVAEQVNAGALNTPGVTCTATVGPASESSREEIARQKKTGKKNGHGITPISTPEPPPQPGAGTD